MHNKCLPNTLETSLLTSLVKRWTLITISQYHSRTLTPIRAQWLRHHSSHLYLFKPNQGILLRTSRQLILQGPPLHSATMATHRIKNLKLRDSNTLKCPYLAPTDNSAHPEAHWQLEALAVVKVEIFLPRLRPWVNSSLAKFLISLTSTLHIARTTFPWLKASESSLSDKSYSSRLYAKPIRKTRFLLKVFSD